MSWTNWPPFSLFAPPSAPSVSSNVQIHDTLIQLSFAARERNVATASVTGGPRHPKHSLVWDRGVITGITPTSITIAGKTWDTTGTFNNPWASVNNADAPGSYDIVIADCVPKRVIHTHVSAIPAGDTVTVPDMTHFVTERVVPTLASRTGRTAFIIRFGGLWPSERILEWPNDLVYERQTTIGSTATTLSSSASWTVNQWAGYDVLFRNSGSAVDRGRISGNTADGTLSFTTERGFTPVVGEDFYIVKANALFEWARIAGTPGTYTTPAPILAWNRGPTLPWYSHYPADANPSDPSQSQPISSTQKPRLTMPVDGIFPDPTVFDHDYYTGTNPADPDSFKCPDIWKAIIRQNQAFIEELAEFGSFIDPTRNYDGVKVRPSGFRAATLFAKAGINAQQSVTGQHVGTSGIRVALQIPAYMKLLSTESIDVFYAIVDESSGSQVVLKSGTPDSGATWQNGVLAGDFSLENVPNTTPPTYFYENRKIIVSLGQTRYLPREVKYLYDKEAWVPDRDPGSGLLVNAPTSDFPGSWAKRPRSSYYVEHSGLGFVQESTFNRDRIDGGGGSLGDGVLVRYVGDNWPDPGICGLAFFDASADPETVLVYNRFRTGRYAQPVQDMLDGQRSGTATSGTTRSLTDTSKDWFTNNWYLGGVLLAFVGTPTGFTSTSITDTTQAADGRWNPAKNFLLRLIIELKVAGVWYRRPITAHAGQTLSWSEALPGTITDYQIRAPKYERNRWAGGQKVIIGWPDLSTQTVGVDYSDDNTLFFNTPLNQAVVAGCSWAIDEAQVGTVWLRKDAAWAKPTGIDARSAHFGVGTPEEFRDDQRYNAPTAVKRFGRSMLGDYVNMTVLMELYDCFNWLQWTIGDFSWETRHNPAVPELNHRQNFRANGGGAGFDTAESDYVLDYVYDVLAGPPDNVPPGNPVEGGYPDGYGSYPICAYATRTSPLNWGNPGPDDIIRAYGYGQVSVGDGDTCPVTSITDFYVKTATPFSYLSPLPAAPDLPPISCTGNFYSNTGDVAYSFQFDANGSNVECGKFKLAMVSDVNYPNGTGLTDRRSGRFGNNTGIPSRPGNPAPGQASTCSAFRGWEAVQWFQITRWNFTYAIPISQLRDGGTARTDNPAWFNWWML